MTSKLALETIKQSNFSPSIVANEERLIRLFFATEHIVNESLIETAITTQDLKRGYSVDRELFYSQETMNDREKEQMNKKPLEREKGYISTLCVEEIRSLKSTNNDRAFVVLDDGIQTNPAHAILRDAFTRSDPELRKLKYLLIPILQEALQIK